MNKLEDLRNFFAKLASGPVVGADEVERLLYESWSELEGNGLGGMEAYKLLKRTANMSWNVPVLEFEIERHGATVQGSVYAGVQTWQIDVRKGVASLGDNEKKRLVEKRAKPLKVEPIMEEIETLILGRKKDPHLKWLSAKCVRVEISKVVPATNKQTTSARRRRFKKALEDKLKVAGWHKVSGKLNTFAS